MIGPMLADFGLRFVYVVLLLTGLSFLGLGVQPPDGGLGLAGAREHRRAGRWRRRRCIAPALAIATLTIAVNLVIDNLPGRTARERGAR